MNLDRDYVTVLRTAGKLKRANKCVTRLPDGKVKKFFEPDRGYYWGATVPVRDIPALAGVLLDIADKPDTVLSLGIFKDSPPPGELFHVWPQAAIAERLKVPVDSEKRFGWHEFDGERVVARLAVNMDHSNYLLSDRDCPPGTPPELAALISEQWLDAMDQIWPGLASCGRVFVPSSSGRILDHGRALESNGFHLFVKTDASQLGRVWPQLLIKAFAITLPSGQALGFMRPKFDRVDRSKVVARQEWAIFDPSTIGSERLVFDGQPSIIGGTLLIDKVRVAGCTTDGLELREPAIVATPGPVLDPDAFADVTREQAEPAARHGVKLSRQKRKDGSLGIAADFKLDVATVTLSLETEDGAGKLKTVGQMWLDGDDKARVQSPFRESTSLAAYFNVHGDGVPFIFDSGTRTKYLLTPDALLELSPDDFMAALKDWLATVGGALDDVAKLDAARAKVRNVVNAAVRLAWEDSAVDVLIEQLAALMAKPCGMTKLKMAASFRKDARKAARAHTTAHAFASAEDQQDKADDLLATMNARFAVVTVGGSVRVAEPDVYDPCLNRKFIRIMGDRDFKLAHMNVKIATPTRTNPDHETPLGQWWLEHPGRRQHLGGITLDPSGTLGPDYLNTWRGWAVEPVAGSCDVFLDHIAMMCGSDDEAAKYALRWCAYKIQHPAERMEVAMVMRGDEGTGKGALGHAMRRIFGSHGLHISQAEHLVGKFNEHLRDCCLLFADEAFFAGDPRHANVLKALITEDTVMVEKKYVDAVQSKNSLGIMMASNNDFVVPAGKDARQFFCLNVPDTHKGDRAYFDPYWAAVADPAQLGAFLHYLLNLDLSDFHIRAFPQTAMLTDQKIASLDQNEKWLINRLGIGHFPDAGFQVETDPGGAITMATWTWHEWISTQFLFKDYTENMRQMGRPQFALDIARFGTFMSRYFPCTRPRGNGRIPGYRLGCLDEARAAFAQYHGLTDMDWQEGEEVDAEPSHASRRAG